MLARRAPLWPRSHGVRRSSASECRRAPRRCATRLRRRGPDDHERASGVRGRLCAGCARGRRLHGRLRRCGGGGCRQRVRRAGDGSRSELLRRRRRRHRVGPGRKQRERVEVPLGLIGATDAEVHVRLRNLDVARRSDPADEVALRDLRAVGDRDRAEMRERDGVAVGGRDRQALAGGRDGPGERDRPGRRRDDRRLRGAADVDPSVLPGRVRMRRIEDERLEHRPVGGPGPGTRDGCEQKRSGNRREQCSAHGLPLELGPLGVPGRGNVCSSPTVEAARRRCQTRLQSCHKDAR